ncbi:MAG: hypothetical protein ACOX6T_00725 [Myxococcales bacterium]
MPVFCLVRLGWILDPPEPYCGAEVEVLRSMDGEIWALRVLRDGSLEEVFFSGSEELGRHLRLDGENAGLQISSVRPTSAKLAGLAKPE